MDGVTAQDLPSDVAGQDLPPPDGTRPDTPHRDTTSSDTTPLDTSPGDVTPQDFLQDASRDLPQDTSRDLPQDTSRDLPQDGPATVTISGTVDLARSCSATADQDCEGVLYVGAYTALIPPFEPNNYVAHWESGTSIDMKSAAPVAFEIKNLPANATYRIWSFLAENPAMYVVSDPNDYDLTNFSGEQVAAGTQDVSGVTLALDWRWIGG
jgi:hypothetical protein